MLVQIHHDRVQGLLLDPALANLGAALLADAFHRLQSRGFVLDDVEDLRAELVDQPLCIRGADAFDQTGAEVALHPFR